MVLPSHDHTNKFFCDLARIFIQHRQTCQFIGVSRLPPVRDDAFLESGFYSESYDGRTSCEKEA